VRTGERDLTFVDRAVVSLERQTHTNVHAIIVAYRNAAAVHRWVGQRRPKLASVVVVESPDPGIRSTSLWTGLAQIKTDFFGVLDDDDTIMPDHVAACLRALCAHAEMDVAFGGSILVNEDAHLDEPRSISYFQRFDAEQFSFGNFITSNAWLARVCVLARAGDDPKLPVCEDYYLLLRFLRGTNFLPTWRLTSEHYRRSDDPTDSNALGEEVRSQSMERIRRRTYLAIVQQRPTPLISPLLLEILKPNDRPMALIFLRLLQFRFLLKGLADYLRNVREIPRRAWKLPGIVSKVGFRGLRTLIVAHGREIDEKKLGTTPSNRVSGR